MKPDCIAAVQAAADAAGLTRRTDAQIQAIEARIRDSMRELARTDEAWQSKSAADRLRAAGAKAVADIRAEAEQKVMNAQRRIIQAGTEHRLSGQSTSDDPVTRAVNEIATMHPDMLVALDGMDAMPVAELLRAIQDQAASDVKATSLVQAAASCFLRMGGMGPATAAAPALARGLGSRIGGKAMDIAADVLPWVL